MTYLDESRVIDDTIYSRINDYFKEENLNGDTSLRDTFFRENIDYFFLTEDGSYSIRSREINSKVETLHTRTGAISEAFEKFIKPMKFDYNEDICVLDICTGLGYNTTALVDDFSKNTNGKTSLTVDCVEISRATLAAGLIVPSPIKSHDLVKITIEDALINDGYIKNKAFNDSLPGNIGINFFIDDARRVIQDLDNNKYDAIFLDPFSQVMSPELFSLDFFKHFYRVINKNGIVATYTSSSPVRSAFIRAGFHVGLGPVFGRKQGGTLASKNPEKLDKSLPLADEVKIALSDVGVPFYDPDLNWSTSEVTEYRQKLRHDIRHKSKISSAVKSVTFLGEDLNDEPLKRRVERNLAKIGIKGLKSKEAYFIVEPKKDYTEEYLIDNNSRSRILDMESRLEKFLAMNNNRANSYKCGKCGQKWSLNGSSFKCPYCGSFRVDKVINKHKRKNRPLTGNPNKDYHHHHRLYNNDDFGSHTHHVRHSHHHDFLWLFNMDSTGKNKNHWMKHSHKHFHDYDFHKCKKIRG